MLRSTSGLKPGTLAVVVASLRAVRLTSPKKVKRGDSADTKCSANWPSAKLLLGDAPLPWSSVAAKSRSVNPMRCSDGYWGFTSSGGAGRSATGGLSSAAVQAAPKATHTAANATTRCLDTYRRSVPRTTLRSASVVGGDGGQP